MVQLYAVDGAEASERVKAARRALRHEQMVRRRLRRWAAGASAMAVLSIGGVGYVATHQRQAPPLFAQSVPQQAPAIVKPGKRSKAKSPVEPAGDPNPDVDAKRRPSARATEGRLASSAPAGAVKHQDKARVGQKVAVTPMAKPSSKASVSSRSVVTPKATMSATPRPTATPAKQAPAPVPTPTSSARPTPIRELVGDVTGVLGKVL